MSVFKVKEISCAHCEKAIKNELKKEDSKISVDVDIQNKTITVENLSDDRVIFLLEEIGYTAEKLK